jgi:PAS domain S-box-containing protein
LDHAHDAIARVEFDGETPVIREATPEFRALFEPSGADVVGQDIDEVVASDAEFERAREISLRTKEGESMRGEATRDTVDGPRDFIWQAVPIQDPETGAFDGGFAIYTDITEQRNRERELERYREFIEQSTDIVTVLDASGRIEFTSPAVETVLGYGQSELVGEDPLEYTHPEDRGRVRVAVEQALAERDTVRTVEFRFEHADGSWVWVESRGRNRLDDPNIEGLVLSQRDITDRVEREQRLQRERDRLDEFASIVSHDLRNPLNVAEGRVELAQQDCESPHLDGVARAHDRIRGLIEDLLILARQGKSIDEQETVDLASTVDQCWQTVETADASLFVETERTVQADANRLRQLLTNLFRNAIEHAGDDVTVTVGDLDTREGFYVADDGPGIDSGEREAVFETGYSTADEGTGFGLNIVQEIAEAHEWTIEIADSETAGARFEIAGTDTTDSQPE